MRIVGPSADAASFLQSLNPQRLAEVVADLLAVRGHTQIKIVDGPGDGGRDIHSRDKRRQRHLVQCKFHRKPTVAVRSSEIAELPMAMVKLGYKIGLFVTNGRISPQSKREFLDNYPDLTLDFIDGTELVAEVLHNVLLRAIWVTGAGISRVSYAVSIPVLARDLERDKPLSLETEVGDGTVRVRSAPGGRFEEVDVRLHVTSVAATPFEPYRAPRVKTMAEGWFPDIRVGELLITRLERLDQIRLLRWFFAHRLLTSVARASAGRRHLALRLGVPSLTPLGGQQAAMRIELDFEPLTMVYHDGQIDTESDWLLPDYGPEWYRQISYVRRSRTGHAGINRRTTCAWTSRSPARRPPAVVER